MPYFFKHINTKKMRSRYDKYKEIIYNIDKFREIHRINNIISAVRICDDETIKIAICKTDSGARYLMECILCQKEVDYKELIYRERSI